MNTPLPGQHLTVGRADELADVDAGELARMVAELVEQVDSVRAAIEGGVDPELLAKQTELLERAHEVLTAALTKLDGV